MAKNAQAIEPNLAFSEAKFSIRNRIHLRQYTEAINQIEEAISKYADQDSKMFLEMVDLKAYCLIRMQKFKEFSEMIEDLGGFNDAPRWEKLQCFLSENEEMESLVPFRLQLCTALYPFLSGGNALRSLDFLSAMQYDILKHLLYVQQDKQNAAQESQEKWKFRFCTVIHISALLLLTMDYPQEAISILQEELLSRFPNNFETLLLLGQISLTVGAYEAAEKYFNIAASQHPDCFALCESNRALLATFRGEMEQAVEKFTQATELCQIEMGKSQSLQESNPHLNDSFKHSPSFSFSVSLHSITSNNLAVAYFYSKRLFDATLTLERLIDQDQCSVFPTNLRNLLTLYEFSSSKGVCTSYISGVVATAAKQDPEVMEHIVLPK